MTENGSALGAKPKAGWFPIEVLRRQDGAFSSYREATWCIFPLNASKLPYGGTTPCGRFSCLSEKYPHAEPKVNSSLQPSSSPGGIRDNSQNRLEIDTALLLNIGMAPSQFFTLSRKLGELFLELSNLSINILDALFEDIV